MRFLQWKFYGRTLSTLANVVSAMKAVVDRFYVAPFSAILRSRADSWRSYVILHEWMDFDSAFLNIHRSGVLTVLYGRSIIEHCFMIEHCQDLETWFLRWKFCGQTGDGWKCGAVNTLWSNTIDAWFLQWEFYVRTPLMIGNSVSKTLCGWTPLRIGNAFCSESSMTTHRWRLFDFSAVNIYDWIQLTNRNLVSAVQYLWSNTLDE